MPNLSETHPQLCNEWHPTKNGQLVPASVSYGSVRKVWWLGSCSHEWEAVIQSRTSGTGCPFCCGRKVLPGFNDIGTTHKELAEQWNTIKNFGSALENFSAGSQKKVWWKGECTHEWEAKISNRAFNKSDCPFCARLKVLKGFNDLATTHPELSSEWNTSKNENLLADEILSGSHKKVWWQCELGHEWKSSPNSRTTSHTGCPICSGNKTLSGYNDFLSSHPDLAREWNYTKNTVAPDSITGGSNFIAWWLCTLGHEWETAVTERVRGKKCPYCSNKKVLAGYNDIVSTHPLIASEWNHKRNTPLLPSTVTYGHGKPVWWICSKGHEWNVAPYNRVFYKTSCPECASKIFISKAEHEIAQFLMQKGVTVKQSERSLLRKMEIDIYLPEHKVGIEFNGVYWHSEAAGRDKTYHYDKFLAAKNAGIQLIQIWEDDWNRNPEQIKAMLLHKLGKSNAEKVYARETQVVTLSQNQVEPFLEKNHIQGYESGSYCLGLEGNLSGEINAVMVLKKEPENTLSIVRYATSKIVVGGFTKLLSYAEKEYATDVFIALSDNCMSDGNLYANNGFVIDKEVAPDYMYVVKSQRQHKFGYTLKRFRDDPKLQWIEGMTEKELVELNNLNRIWDAGRIRWAKYRNERRMLPYGNHFEYGEQP